RDVAVAAGAITPGEPDFSELLRRVTSDDEFERMPPAEAGDPLSPSQIATLTAWIKRGAPYASHWAYERDRNVVPPAIASDRWPANPIDAFILARLDDKRLDPSPAADRATLVRRVHLDLVGLLPSPDEVARFVNDPR